MPGICKNPQQVWYIDPYEMDNQVFKSTVFDFIWAAKHQSKLRIALYVRGPYPESKMQKVGEEIIAQFYNGVLIVKPKNTCFEHYLLRESIIQVVCQAADKNKVMVLFSAKRRITVKDKQQAKLLANLKGIS